MEKQKRWKLDEKNQRIYVNFTSDITPEEEFTFLGEVRNWIGGDKCRDLNFYLCRSRKDSIVGIKITGFLERNYYTKTRRSRKSEIAPITKKNHCINLKILRSKAATLQNVVSVRDNEISESRAKYNEGIKQSRELRTALQMNLSDTLKYDLLAKEWVLTMRFENKEDVVGVYKLVKNVFSV